MTVSTETKGLTKAQLIELVNLLRDERSSALLEMSKALAQQERAERALDTGRQHYAELLKQLRAAQAAQPAAAQPVQRTATRVSDAELLRRRKAMAEAKAKAAQIGRIVRA